MQTVKWQRPSSCSEAACVEVYNDGHGSVSLRSSKSRDYMAVMDDAEWNQFIEAVKAGEYD